MHLKLLYYTFVSFSDPCNKVNTEPSFRSTTGATPPVTDAAGGLLVLRRLAAMLGIRLSYGRATSAPGLSSAVPGVLARSLASDVWKLCAFQGPPSAS